MRRVLIALAALAAVLIGSLWWAVRGEVRGGRIDVQPATLLAPPEGAHSSTITVVSWNIAWGFGWGSEYRHRVAPKTAADLERSLRSMGARLAEWRADLVLLQEVDFGARRSFGVDQARLLAEVSGLPYVAPVVSWDLNYLPFPYWPPARHIGRIRSGGAILSRWPLEGCWAELLPKPAAQPFWYRPFYLWRYAQGCRVLRPEGALWVWNTHLEAFDAPNRLAQSEALAALLAAAPKEGLIFGGDLNSVPPEAKLRSGYPDEPETDHRGDRTLEILRAVPGLRPVVSSTVFAADPDAWSTFPSHAPNRALDHLFVGSELEVVEARVGREAGEVSDHLPVVVRLVQPAR